MPAFHPSPSKGRLAFISQSAAVANTILDWAQQREVGFSYFIALGDSLDIDVDDLLDFLARDSKTSAIMLYIEHISDARRFLSASRSASRNKPVLVVKSGRSQRAQQLLNGQQDWMPPMMPLSSGPGCCEYRIPMNCSLPLRLSAICAHCAVNGC